MKTVIRIVKKVYHFLLVAYLWITRIVLAPSHFRVPWYIRVRMNIHGFIADQYVLFDLKHHSMKDYLSELDWYRSRFVNDKYRLLLNDKLVCNDLLSGKVPVPAMRCFKKKGHIMNEHGKRISTSDVMSMIMKQGDMFLKPISSGKGKNIFLIRFAGNAWFLDDDQVSEDRVIALLDRLDHWFLAGKVQQGAFPDELYSRTTNTIRLITLRDPDTNVCKVCYAVQRMGTKKSYPVDNASRGGLIARIDMDTGILSSARSLHAAGEYRVHPDSGAVIEGKAVPHWREIKQQVLTLAEGFSYLKLIAWDILITDQGICMIEANASSGINILQLWEGQRKKELGEFLRRHHMIC